MAESEEIQSTLPSLKTAADRDQFINSFATDLNTRTIRKGYIVWLHSKNEDQKDFSSTAKKILGIADSNNIVKACDVNFEALKRSVIRVISDAKKKINFVTQGANLVRKLQEDFCIPVQTPTSFDSVVTMPDEKCALPSAVTDSYARSLEETGPKRMLVLPKSFLKKLKTDCNKCHHKRKVIQTLSRLSEERRRKVDELYVSSNEGRCLRQALARKIDIEKNLRDEKQQLKADLAHANSNYKKLLKKVTPKKFLTKKKKYRCKSKWVNMMKEKEQEIKRLKKRTEELERENQRLRDFILGEKSDKIIIVKQHGQFIPKYRKAAYHCFMNQVPVERVGSVIKNIVQEVAGGEVSASPSAATVSQMAYELTVLSDLQVGESLAVEEDMTIAWDATSLSDKHVNEVHILFKDEPPRGLSLQISTLPGGTTEDYFEHITTSVRDVVTTCAQYKCEDAKQLETSVFNRIKNTVSDRVSVNHCVVKKLEEDLNIQLLELKCNVHPLDGMSNKCRGILKELEEKKNIKTSLLGRDCVAANIAHDVSKMRYRQGKGDPKGFKSFLQQEKIPLKYFVRYVGNRLHVMFYLAGVIFTYREKILQYLDKICSNRSGLRTGLISALSHSSIQLHLKALGLIGKLVSGPWMRVVYGNKDKKSNLELVPTFQKVLVRLQNFVSEDILLSLLQAQEDVFGQALDLDDDILQSLQSGVSSQEEDEFRYVLQELVKGVISVMEKQMGDYLTGDLSAPTEQMLEQTKSAPCHNMMSERILGMTDYQTRRAANAKIGFIEGKVKASTNKVLEWLESKDTSEQDKLVLFAVRHAREVRDIRKRREEQMTKVYQERQKLKQQKREQAFRMKIERNINNLITSPKEIDIQFFEDCGLPDSIEKSKTINEIISDPSCLVDRKIEHFWFEGDGKDDVLCHGHIIELKQEKRKQDLKKPLSVIVTYWREGENEEDDGTDNKVTLAEILCDFLLEDLSFS